MTKTIAVASGKGGVGKSTVSINVALALSRKKIKVGILDADIYGPNIPLMLGIDKAVATVENSKILPVQKHGIEIMSVAFVVPPEKALLWRGPMANKLIEQFLTDVKWGDLDILIIDLPPGTGDVPLSIVQKAKLDCGIIVTTPQEASIADVKKMINMFQTTHTPIMGIVENMIHIECPKCHHSIEMFPPSPIELDSVNIQYPRLGKLPFNTEISRRTEDGFLFLFKDHNNPFGEQFSNIADAIIKYSSS